MRLMRQWAIRCGLALCGLALLAACGGASPPTAAPATSTTAPTSTSQPATPTAEPAAAGQVLDVPSLIDFLEARGLTVAQEEGAQQPFLNTGGAILNVSGGDLAEPARVEAYHYQDADIAEADAAGIGPDGSPPTMMIMWMAPPHFYRSERVIVLYVGADGAMTKLLTEAMGPQFAGL